MTFCRSRRRNMTPTPARIFLLVVATLSFTSGSRSSEAPSLHLPEVSPSSRGLYAYAYDVRDPQSGVYTSKKETRDGDVVYGNYVVEEPDSRRSVYYSADASREFGAEIRRYGSQQQVQERVHPVPVPIPIALPVVQAYAAAPPVQAYAAPPLAAQVHQVQFGTPVAVSLAPAILARTSSDYNADHYHTSLTSPTHGYSY